MPMTDDLETRRKRARFRSWHRGTKEADLVLGGFADRHLATLDEHSLEMFEALLEVADADLLDWIFGRVPVPESHDNLIMARLRTFDIAGYRQ